MKKIKNSFNGKWLACAVVAALFTVLAAGCGSPDSSSTPSVSEPDESGRYHVGDTALHEKAGVTVTYKECETNWEGNWNDYGGVNFGPDEDQMIIRVYFTMTNTGKDKQAVGSEYFDCTFDGATEGNDYEDLFLAHDEDANSMPGVEEIAVGKSVEGNIYYRIPKDAQNIEVTLGSLTFVVE